MNDKIHCEQSRSTLATGSPLQAIRFNINEYFRVKLTASGRAIHREEHDVMSRHFPAAEIKYRAPVEDTDGWSKWQAWSLMQTFGPYISMGSEPPFETNIEVLVNAEVTREGTKENQSHEQSRI